ncbi:hypothetical protein HN592_00960 [Candidatus Woesearchaeota archaeon]|jgi:phosphatidylserine/phosphatidylglycerophosphate/cardiolipin synthase-like enzyme|nr:hypothetical protein [Candidatus Woesearchaeota archaeon]MBT4368874.1 hypothetical protein [Candidatus Woesearchaeota archaeon]MBT4712163.1 hypothetical protein [Candidatus Woesearchaeota archaeon]MBT6639089.1 hypothetical protein [Candidatus Woesearchaeota archaeon]MBT7134289.1 hypothetical protein [Candidatus Woesearchaeota archaeon]
MKYILLLLLLCGCTVQNTVLPSEKGDVEVLFCLENQCEDRFLELTNNSQTQCAFYKSNLENINENIDELVVHNRKYGLMHNKFCIINESIVWTGSYNPTRNKNDNNVVVIESKYLAENYLQEFEELKNNKFGYGEKVKYPRIILGNMLIENYFCPEDNCKEQVLKTLIKARKSIHFMTFSFTDSDIAGLLIEKSRQIEVRGVMERQRVNMQYNKFKQMNKSFQIELDNNPAVMHHKVFVIDSQVVIMGSMNPTKSGDERNDENVVIIHNSEVAELFIKEFERVSGQSQSSLS